MQLLTQWCMSFLIFLDQPLCVIFFYHLISDVPEFNINNKYPWLGNEIIEIYSGTSIQAFPQVNRSVLTHKYSTNCSDSLTDLE
jgi:hypothetical protein